MADSDPVGAGVHSCGGGSLNNSSSAFEQSEEVVSKDKKSWIAIKLVDEDGKPVPGEEYRITLPGGTPVEGYLDKRGFKCLRGIDPGTCSVAFPKLDDPDWRCK
jgi:hypothetical protein